MSTVLALMPVLEGNETIPKMYSRFLINKPLVLYLSENVRNSTRINDFYIITDDENIAHISELHDFKYFYVSSTFQNGNMNFDKLLFDVREKIEEKEKKKYDYIIILNPNWPLIRSETLDYAIYEVIRYGAEIGISVRTSNEIEGSYWLEKDDGFGKKINIYNEKQFQKGEVLKKIDGLFIIKTDIIKYGNWENLNKIKLLRLNFPENLDVNTHLDWWIIEKYLKRKRILIRADGYNEIGLGHIYRTLSLANQLIDHEISFVSKKEHQLGVKLIQEHNYDIKTFTTNSEFNQILEEFKPNIVINDILDTEREYVLDLKKKGYFVVNFEDLGPGAIEADLVINALFKRKNFYENHYWGRDYYILREEFFMVGKKKIKEKVENILITFGGTDPNNYTERILKILNEMGLNDVKINVIVGLGYKNVEKLKERVKNYNLNMTIKQHVKNISKYMHEADIAITPAGRTVYELASIGVPTIVLVENEPSLLHAFANEKNGIINLGLGYEIPDEKIKNAIKKLMNDYGLRKKCNELMLKNNLKSGINNVLGLIFSKYEKFEQERINHARF
ncbi:MAG: UDP-2,4-diacetamido-2,4,6-trideoxy-beta-L-altropyranose hydrolase [Promethearchaeota archaeon]